MRNITIVSAGVLSLAVGFIGCTSKTKPASEISFTKIDSVTERYLELQDSMLNAWNTMIGDDNRKFRYMHKLLHELMAYDEYDKEKLIKLEDRLNQLTNFPFTQENIDNPELVDEYDFSTNSLVTELLSLAESHPAFSHDLKIQKTVEEIKLADQQVDKNRSNYDIITLQYNHFLDKNKNLIKEIDEDIPLKKKPLFQMIAHE